MPRGLKLCGALALVALAAGCHEDHPPLLPVSGKVTYRAAPVSGGTIVFAPDASRGCHGPIALGEIERDGTYRLRTNDVPGAAPGWYRVTVASVAPVSVQLPGQPYSIPTSPLPERYRDPDLSNLRCEVRADRVNTINFDLD
jgi:hypothetical protein